MSHFNKGKKHSDETKAKMSLAHKGRVSYNYGKKHTQETIEKMSVVKRGKTHSEATKKKISESHNGKKIPQDVIDRIVKTKKSKYKRIHPGEIGSKEYIRSSGLLCAYGITMDDYNKMFDLQNGECAICRRHQTEFKSSLNVDHDHNTGVVRGLLCHKCNKGIGLFNDSVDLIKSALNYIIGEK